MFIARLWQVLLAAVLVSAANPTPTSKRQSAPDPKFVGTEGGKFVVNGAPLDFVGTNAYWLPTLNSEADIDNTLANIKASGIKVVRTWAFNDVEKPPVNGTWFQLIGNGTTSVNDGPNGLQKLDTVVRLAEKHNLYVLLTLTNNWNPIPQTDKGANVTTRDVTPGTGNTLARNTLSNDYGGMDAYVREFSTLQHDEFYTNSKILTVFMNYTTQVVQRYVNSPSVFAWELANDPRCNSTLPSTSSCTPQTITKWHSKIAQHIKSIDPNHLVSSGNQGFFCVDCPKLFPRVPPPQTSPAPGRRSVNAKRLTKRGILEERKASLKKTRNSQKRNAAASGIRIRGRWSSTETRRQSDQGLGPAFDGSQGIDSEDILGIPQIGFSTFQLFPDQVSYGPDDPNLSKYDNVVNQGKDWITKQADLGKIFGKPVSASGFGLVTKDNTPSFVPFNTTQAPFGPDSSTPAPVKQAFGVTDQQRDDAYTSWLQAGLQAGVSSMFQYQWSQSNLTAQVGTTVSPVVTGTTVSPLVPGTGVSPNDGYSLQGTGQLQAQDVLQQASVQYASDSS